MIADVLQKYVGYPVSLFAVEGDEERFGERAFQKGFDAGEFFCREGHQRFQRRGEAKRLRVLQEEAQVIVGEVPFKGVKGDYAAGAPVKEGGVCEAVTDAAVEHFAQEHCNGVLVHIAPQAEKRMQRGDVPGAGQLGLGIFYDVRLKDAQGQEHCHRAPLSNVHNETAPSVLPCEAVEHYCVVLELGKGQDYQLGVACHLTLSLSHWAIRRRDIPLWEMLFFISSPSSAIV